MNIRFREELSPTLAESLDAAHAAPPPNATDLAQQRLLARLHGAQARTSAVRRGPWLAAASAALLAVAVVGVPLLTDQGNAFAKVQAHLRDFRTLSMQVQQRFGGRIVQESHMTVDARGVLRTDVGDQISVVVDPVHGRMLVLQHGPRQAMSVPIDQAAGSPDESLDWLAEIRDFKGEARQLEETRTIDGRTAHGWALEVEGTQLVLWADGDGLPLAMETGGAGGLEIRYRFEFDAPIAPGYLSSEVPAGYKLVGEDES